eukprot:2076480-Alexandrium_andersonii.AAC.1
MDQSQPVLAPLPPVPPSWGGLLQSQGSAATQLWRSWPVRVRQRSMAPRAIRSSARSHGSKAALVLCLLLGQLPRAAAQRPPPAHLRAQ